MLFYVLFVCKCVLPPDDNPTAVNKYIIYYNMFRELSRPTTLLPPRSYGKTRGC